MARGAGRAWAAAAVLCTLLVLVHAVREPMACNIQCCTFSPSCLGATHMNCHCPDTNSILLRNGDIPSTVQYIEIFPAKEVTIGRRALFDLPGLRDLTVRDVDSLEVLSDGLALSEFASLQTLRLERLDKLTLHPDALSGRWPASAEISMHRITYMRMEPRALHFEANDGGPNVLLEHVTDLYAKGDAFRATMRRLALVDVSMRACQPGTFRGLISQLNFIGCQLSSVESRCIQPDGPWDTVSVNACDVGDIHEEAFNGEVGSLLLEASNISKLHSGAVQMSLQRLELERLHIRDMEAQALDVSVCVSVEIMESRVDELRRHALAGVRLAECRRQDRRPFTIHLLHVRSAESGSLAVHESVPASAVNWDSITFDTECSCAMQADISTLVAGDGVDVMTPTQRALTKEVWDRSFCTDAEGDPVRLSDATEGCPDWEGPGGDGASGGGEGGETSLDQNIVFYVVIVGASVLVLSIVSFLIVKRRCVGRVLGCTKASSGGGEHFDTMQSRRTAFTVANSTLSSVGGSSSHGTHLRYEKGMPDLLTTAPGVDLSLPIPESSSPGAHEHIYAEIGPLPGLADYSDPRDSLALRQRAEEEGEAAPERGQYAEIAPLVGEADEQAPPPPPNPPLTLRENRLYSGRDELCGPRGASVTHL